MWNLSDIRENTLLGRWAELLERPSDQVGRVHETDCELIPLEGDTVLAVTVDSVSEEVRHGLYRDPETVGYVAVASSLSDLAAAGANPLGLLLSVTLPAASPEAAQRGLAHGANTAARAAGTFILGGDTDIGPELRADCVGVGTVPRWAVRTRLGAQPGDELWVSGPVGLGTALAAVRVLGVGASFCESDYRPVPRIAEGLALRGIATACMDTSDGLVATIDQLSRLNGIGVVVDPPLPDLLHPLADAMRREAGLPAFAFVAAHHGEFELVFTLAPTNAELLRKRAAELGWTPLCLGRCVAEPGIWFGDTPVDGARVRNLLDECGGDLAAYAASLIVLSKGYCHHG